MRCNRTVVIMALACALMAVPARAYASDGFLGGLEDLTGTRQVEQVQKGYEESYQEGYEPELREVEAAPLRELPEDATTVDYVNSTLDSFNTVNYGSNSGNSGLSLFEMLRRFLGAGPVSNALNVQMRSFVIFVVGIVFMWWGVRKAKSMIMDSFRKGRITT